MEPKTIYINGMVCQRCILAVERILMEAGWTIHDITLGEVRATPPPGGDGVMERVARKLEAIGFRLGEDQHGFIVRVKGVVIDHVYNDAASATVNLSELIVNAVFKEYSYVSRTFSAVTGRTIETFYTDHRMERSRKLLATTDTPISDISRRLKYAAPSHFSAAFRREEGVTPSAYRKNNDFVPRALDEI
ncbi:helix-turn-helix transcriptional regulator [Neolewinella persica]|uniref:helix-turn-helix transcriptional regulator n=1 Tax=Neolewinella persica TaxID=70998 RepID=UPI0003613368|nr:helix-turn-helix transcriptional regulator [Neolewinella persica]